MFCYSKVVTKIQLNEKTKCSILTELFHDGGRYHIETSPLICSLTASVMKELNVDIQFYNNFLPRFNLSDCHQISLLILREF